MSAEATTYEKLYHLAPDVNEIFMLWAERNTDHEVDDRRYAIAVIKHRLGINRALATPKKPPDPLTRKHIRKQIDSIMLEIRGVTRVIRVEDRASRLR